MSRPAIPAAMKRAVQQEAGYRCAIPTCRDKGPFNFEHIVPWAEVKEHEEHNIILLCVGCHARVTRGEISKDAIREYKRNLAIINSRYSLYEMRLIQSFYDNFERAKRGEVFSTSLKTKITNAESGEILQTYENSTKVAKKTFEEVLKDKVYPDSKFVAEGNAFCIEHFHLVPFHDRLHFSGLVRDGLIRCEEADLYQIVGSKKGDSVGYPFVKITLTDSGRKFLSSFFYGKNVLELE